MVKITSEMLCYFGFVQDQGRSQGGGEMFEKSATKTGKIRKRGRKRGNWVENGKLAGSLPLRMVRAGYGPAQDTYKP